MGVGDQNIVDVVGGKVQLVFVVLVLSLLKAAVDEDFLSVDLQTVAAASDRVGGAEKCQFHWIASFICCKWGCLYCTPFPGKKLYQFVNIV